MVYGETDCLARQIGALANRRRPPAGSNDNREHSAPHSGLQAAGGHWGIGEAARLEARAIARCSRDREGEASRDAAGIGNVKGRQDVAGPWCLSMENWERKCD